MRLVKQIAIWGMVGIVMLASTAVAKDLPADSYPPEYEAITQSKWPEVQATLQRFLSARSMDEFAQLQTDKEARFLLARVSKIQWDDKMREDVTRFLGEFAITILSGKSFLPEPCNPKTALVERPGMEGGPAALPRIAIQSMLSVDSSLSAEIIPNVWQLTVAKQCSDYCQGLRLFVLAQLDRHFRNAAIVNCVTRISQMQGDALMPEELELVARFRMKVELSRIPDQKEGWNIVWRRTEEDRVFAASKSAESFVWFRNLLDVRIVYGNLDPRILFSIASEADDVVKKYLFLYCTCFALNSILTPPLTKDDKEFIDQIVHSSEVLLKTDDARLQQVSKPRDFLKQALSSLVRKRE